jgi:hypothetical protein
LPAASPASAPAPASDPLSTLIPYKNVPALVAYYLGVFALIPCFGLPLGLAALILGIVGLQRAGEHPEAKGKVHAWVGIALGGLCFALNTGVILFSVLHG